MHFSSNGKAITQTFRAPRGCFVAVGPDGRVIIKTDPAGTWRLGNSGENLPHLSVNLADCRQVPIAGTVGVATDGQLYMQVRGDWEPLPELGSYFHCGAWDSMPCRWREIAVNTGGWL
jgi:hypothetical protein